MERKVEKSIKQWLGIFLAIVTYYIVHEGMHLVLALLFGVFEKVRFVGIWGVQIVTTDGALNGMSLALFSGLSSIVTILIGYMLAFSPSVYKIKNKNILVGLYYITLVFLLLDPLYMSMLSAFVGGGDINGVVVGLGCSAVPLKIIFGVILVVNLIVFTKKVAPKYNEIFKEN